MTISIKADAGGNSGTIQVNGQDALRLNSATKRISALAPFELAVQSVPLTASNPPTALSEMTFALPTDTQLVLTVKGSDGVDRAVTLTLAV